MEVTPEPDILEKLFRHKVLRLRLNEGAIDEQVVANLLAWPHTGFGAHGRARMRSAGSDVPAGARAGRSVFCHQALLAGSSTRARRRQCATRRSDARGFSGTL